MPSCFRRRHASPIKRMTSSCIMHITQRNTKHQVPHKIPCLHEGGDATSASGAARRRCYACCPVQATPRFRRCHASRWHAPDGAMLQTSYAQADAARHLLRHATTRLQRCPTLQTAALASFFHLTALSRACFSDRLVPSPYLMAKLGPPQLARGLRRHWICERLLSFA